MFEPDFGATVIIVGVVVGMTFLAGAKLVYVLAMMAAAAMALAFLVLSAPYRMKRRLLIRIRGQTLWFGFSAGAVAYCLGQGEWWGLDWQQRSEAFYLPEAHTDFVFLFGLRRRALLGRR